MPRRCIYSGDSPIGYVEIYEGDYVRFEWEGGNAHCEEEGYAFFSNRHTTRRFHSRVTFRFNDCAYGMGDCHSHPVDRLVAHGVSGAVREIKEKPKGRPRGFANFIKDKGL